MLVSRDAEIARISRFLGELPRGSRVLLIEGEAGIGKTTVLKEGQNAAVGLGVMVLSAYPVESEVPLEFAALADLLEKVPADLVDGLPEPQRQAVRQAVLRTEPPQQPADPRTVATAVLTLLRGLARRQPVAVVVDDLPWLDAPSARALSFALRRLRLEPVGLLAAVRTNWWGEPPTLATDSVPAERLDRLRLGPLRLGAIREVLAARTTLSSGPVASLRIHEASGGNPLFALELAARLDAGFRRRAARDTRCARFAASAGGRSALPVCRPGRAMCCWSARFRRNRRYRSSAPPPRTQPLRLLISTQASRRASWRWSAARSLSFIR